MTKDICSCNVNIPAGISKECIKCKKHVDLNKPYVRFTDGKLDQYFKYVQNPANEFVTVQEFKELDLFEHPELLSERVINILDAYAMDEPDYAVCMALQSELNAIGYDFEWGLDGIPFNLHKL
jgi:hypothetical protein